MDKTDISLRNKSRQQEEQVGHLLVLSQLSTFPRTREQDIMLEEVLYHLGYITVPSPCKQWDKLRIFAGFPPTEAYCLPNHKFEFIIIDGFKPTSQKMISFVWGLCGFSSIFKHVWSENLIYLLLILLVLNVEIVVPTADQYARRLGASESPPWLQSTVGEMGPRWDKHFGHVIDIIYRCLINFMNVPSSMILISPFVMLCCRSLFSLSSFMSWPILVTLSLMFNIVSACWMLIEVSAAWSLLLHLSSRESSVFPSITPCWGRCQVCWEQKAEDGHVTANMLKCKQLFGSIVLCDRQMGKEWYICSNQMKKHVLVIVEH